MENADLCEVKTKLILRWFNFSVLKTKSDQISRKNKSMLNKFIPVLLLLLISNFCSSISPVSNDGGSIVGICAFCTVQNPDFAMDGDPTTFQNFEMTGASINTTGKTVFDFGSDIPSSTVLTLELSFPDLPPNSFDASLSTVIYENIALTLFTASNGIIFNYKTNEHTAVELLNGAENRFVVRIINPYNNVRKVSFSAGSITGIVGDVRLYEIKYEQESFIFADNYISSGFFNGTFYVPSNMGQTIYVPQRAVYNESNHLFDVNSKFAIMQYSIATNVANQYLYSRYDWSNMNYSGEDHEVYCTLGDANLVSLSDVTAFFDAGLIEIIVGYSDGTAESFSTYNPLAQAGGYLSGDGRFFIKIDANDTKFINNVEVRFKPLIGFQTQLVIFNIYLSESDINPFSLDVAEVDALKDEVVVYPNPSFGNVTIAADPGREFILSTIDGTKHKEVFSGETINCEPGVYILHDKSGLEVGQRIVVLK